MKVPKHEISENSENPNNYLKILEKMNTFIVDNHNNMQSAFVILSADIDKDKEDPTSHKGLFFLSGGHDALTDNLILAISKVPEMLDLFIDTIIKGGLKKEFVAKVLLYEAKQLIMQKLEESLKGDHNIEPKNN